MSESDLVGSIRRKQEHPCVARVVQEVAKGAKLPGLYPPNEENKKRYEEWKKKR